MKTCLKLITFLIMAIFVASLTACQPAPAATEDAAATEAMEEPTEAVEEHTEAMEEPTEAMEEPTIEPVVEEPTEEPAMEPVTLRYANWNVGTEEENNLQRQLVQAYIDMHPNVTVEFVDMSA
ncbi:MAG: hypothetical protein L0287_24145, partial [Anaerolineae bacterium]|nr:hypothetical protein [Anaerolineae bacterium]